MAQQLLAQVRSGIYEPGMRMPSERELMASLGVGRSTIREALNGLAVLGVIEIRHGQGAFVIQTDPGNAPGRAHGVACQRCDTRPARGAGGSRGGRSQTSLRAGGRRPTYVRSKLSSTSTRPCWSATSPRYELAARFHLEIAEAAHNEVLAGFIESVMGLLMERGPELELRRGYREWELREHAGLLEAVRDGDPELAAQRMREHLGAMTRHHSDMGLA